MHIQHSIYMAITVAALWSSVWADGTITEIKAENSDLKLKTRMVMGNKYQLQCSTNLVAGSWENIGEQITAEKTETNLIVGTEAKSCWFRVVEEKVQLAGPTTPYSPPAAVPPRTPVRKSSI